MTRNNKPRKAKVEKESFKTIIVQYFKQHGVKSPARYLAERGGLSRSQLYWLFNAASNGVGKEKGQLDPTSACFFILQADEVLADDDIFDPTPVEIYLRPLLEKFYQETKKNVTRRKGTRSRKKRS